MGGKLKILQINCVCGYGSTGNITLDLYRELERAGNQCCIAYGRGSAPKNVRSYRIGSNMDVYIHAGISRITDRHGFYSRRATKKFVKWMQQYEPDVIHLHNLHGYFINIKLLFLALKEMRKPVIWTLHDCWTFTGHCAHYSAIRCERWKEGCEYCPQLNKYPASWFLDASRKNYCDKRRLFTKLEKMVIVTPSKWLANQIAESYLKEYPVEVIYNGVDMEIFRPRKSNFREKFHLQGKKIILGVANVWNEGKGLSIFIELAEKLDDAYKIVLVGMTKKQINKLSSDILAIERTADRHELAEIYTAADLYLNPSEGETFGLTTVEALACGTKVLVNNSTALPEIVGYKNEMILDDRNIIKSITCAIDNNISQSDNRALAEKYEKYRQIQQYMKLYLKVREQ